MILVVIIKNCRSKGLNYTWLVIIASVTNSEALVGHLSYEGDLPFHIHVDPAQTPYIYLQFLGWRSCVCMRRCCQDGTWCSYSTGRYMQNWRQYLSIWRWELSLYTDRATKIPKRRLGGLTQLNKNTAFSFTVQFQQYKITGSHQVWLLVKMRYILPGMLCMTTRGSNLIHSGPSIIIKSKQQVKPCFGTNSNASTIWEPESLGLQVSQIS